MYTLPSNLRNLYFSLSSHICSTIVVKKLWSRYGLDHCCQHTWCSQIVGHLRTNCTWRNFNLANYCKYFYPAKFFVSLLIVVKIFIEKLRYIYIYTNFKNELIFILVRKLQNSDTIFQINYFIFNRNKFVYLNIVIVNDIWYIVKKYLFTFIFFLFILIHKEIRFSLWLYIKSTMIIECEIRHR